MCWGLLCWVDDVTTLGFIWPIRTLHLTCYGTLINNYSVGSKWPTAWVTMNSVGSISSLQVPFKHHRRWCGFMEWLVLMKMPLHVPHPSHAASVALSPAIGSAEGRSRRLDSTSLRASSQKHALWMESLIFTYFFQKLFNATGHTAGGLVLDLLTS